MACTGVWRGGEGEGEKRKRGEKVDFVRWVVEKEGGWEGGKEGAGNEGGKEGKRKAYLLLVAAVWVRGCDMCVGCVLRNLGPAAAAAERPGVRYWP